MKHLRQFLMMGTLLAVIVGLGLSAPAPAEPLIEGRVRLASGAPVAAVQVLVFDLTDLQRGPVARATTDRQGCFALPSLGGQALPQSVALGQNYPNPFNPSTIIPYQLPSVAGVRLEVFDLLGQHVATLVDQQQSAGFHTAAWDATNAAGQSVAAGVYLYRLKAGGQQQTGRMVLIDGQAGGPGAGASPPVAVSAADVAQRRYGLALAGAGVVAWADPDFPVRPGMAPLDIVVEAVDGAPRGKVLTGGILGDVNGDGRVDFFDALLVALYSVDPSLVLPNDGRISLGDVNADGRVDLADAHLIAAYLNDPTDPSLPPGIGQPARAEGTAVSKIYWTDSRAGIKRANLDGSSIQELVTGGAPIGIALDVAGGRIYWTDWGTGWGVVDGTFWGTCKIQGANLDGSNVQNLVTGLIAPIGIALDVAGGKIYWTDLDTRGTARIQSASLDGSGILVLVTGLAAPNDIALDVGGGKIYWTDRRTGKIQRANLDGSSIQDLVTGLAAPDGIALDVGGGKIYWTDRQTGKIQRANLDGSSIQDLVTGLIEPTDVALDVPGGKIYWTDLSRDSARDRIQRANLDGSRTEDLVTTGLESPLSIALGGNGGGAPSARPASLSPDPSTVAFADDGAWHRFTVEAGEPVSVVANPGADSPRLEITTLSGRGNYCPGEADDDQSRQDGQAIYLAGCAAGTATVELRREADDTVLRTYTFEVTGSPADLIVASASVSDSSLTPGQSFTLSATVRNQGTGEAAATTLRYYRSTNRTISTGDTQVGTDPVGALAASGTSAESIRLTAPSSAGTWYYGACVESVGGESAGNNCSTGVRVSVTGDRPDLVVQSPWVSDNTLTPGQSFTLRATVRNRGDARSASTTLRYYRSTNATNATITASDTRVGTDAVGGLAPSGARAETISLTAPAIAGTYYYGACVQSVSGESDTNNNCSPGVRVTVSSGGGDDHGDTRSAGDLSARGQLPLRTHRPRRRHRLLPGAGQRLGRTDSGHQRQH